MANVTGAPPINAPGDPTRSKASPELRELARLTLAAGTEPEKRFAAETLAAACELENVNVFKLLAEEQSEKGGS